MKKKAVSLKYFPLLTILIFLIGLVYHCAPSAYMQGHRALEQGDYDQALEYYKTALEQNIYDAEVIRDLGITLYFKDRLKVALGLLSLAEKKLPGDANIYYYKGLIYQKYGKGDEAIRQFRHYDELSLLHPLRKEMENRLGYLLHQKMRVDTKKMLQNERNLDALQIPANSLAVFYFSNMSDNTHFVPLQKGLADMIITDLSQIKSLTIVERIRMDLLIQELQLGMSGLMDKATAARMGRLLGAEKVVSGTLVGLGDHIIRIDMGIIDSKNNSIGNEKISGSLEQFYQLEKDIVFKLVALLRIKLTSAERQTIEKIPTKNLLAFMAYCRGLDFEDHGNWREAQQEFSKAHQQDPGFYSAQQKAQANAAYRQIAAKTAPVARYFVTASQGEIRQKHAMQSISPAKKFMINSGFDRKGMLFRAGNNVGRGFVPGLESRKPVTESKLAGFGNSTTIEFRIPVPLKP
ncbi:tetratricopeptide repeat protein [candidate division KSB1 bacterium]|nr:tetratricopeptide repeat protein [candidate division KSB1 bacterium]